MVGPTRMARKANRLRMAASIPTRAIAGLLDMVRS
jgi:hypothetical protein